MHRASISVLRRRPISTFITATTAGTCAAAVCVESYSERSSSSTQSSDVHQLNLPHSYDRERINSYWIGRPLTVAGRIIEIGSEVLPLLLAYQRLLRNQVKDVESDSSGDKNYNDATNSKGRSEKLELEHQQQHRQIQHQERHDLAVRLRETLTRLGPAFVKFGQQLSIRPDIMPPDVLKELQRLCDEVEPMERNTAMDVLYSELGNAVEGLGGYDALELVASASLGQVYKTKIVATGEEVAIKIQRPDMQKRVALDLFLLNRYGAFVDTFTSIFTNQMAYHVDFIDCFARGSYMELDYKNEASNQQYFRSEFLERGCPVHIPIVHDKFTTRRVLTTEWVDGVKLADAGEKTIRRLIPVGVELFLTQLLDIGAFHADPHPGNLYVTDDGRLCLLDFGLCANIEEHARRAMTTAIVHLLTGDFDSLIEKDAKDLGFLPKDTDVTELKPILTKILNKGLLQSGSNLGARKRNLMSISNELNEVFFRYPFSVPPFFALVTRGLGLLEGIALSGDPSFDIFEASFPYARKRAIKIFGPRKGWKHQLSRSEETVS